MNVLKLIDDYLIIYNEHERLYQELQEVPVVYFADYKVQKNKLPSGNTNLMIRKFDKSTRDYERFCDIKLVNVEPAEPVIHLIDRESSSLLVAYVNKGYPLITHIGNFIGRISRDTTRDEFFNLTLGYDINFKYEEMLELLDKIQPITKHSWIYKV